MHMYLKVFYFSPLPSFSLSPFFPEIITYCSKPKASSLLFHPNCFDNLPLFI